MLRNASAVIGLPVRARDGDAGEVVDLLFDDRDFTVRWIVVDTGNWLPGRKVLVPPGRAHVTDGSEGLGGVALSVEHARQEIEAGPGIDRDAPVSRRHEESMVAHYRWTPWWTVGGAGTGALEPVPPLATGVPDVEPAATDAAAAAADVPEGDPALRSAREVTGYYIHAADGFVGHVSDLLLGADDWVIRYLMVDTRNWLPGRRVLLSPGWVRGIAWADREVLVDHVREDVKSAPPYDPDVAIDRDFENRLHRHYGFAPYWI